MVVGFFDDGRVVFRLRVGTVGQGILLQRSAHNDAPLPVDMRHLDAGMQTNVVVAIPGQRIDEDVGCLLASVQDVAQQNAVVVAVRLGAEHDDVELVRGSLQDFFNYASSRHSIADDNQSFSCPSDSRSFSRFRLFCA